MSSRATGSDEHGNGSLTEQIVRKVADLENVDPIKLNPPLGEVLDPDALSALFEDPGHAVQRLTFVYKEYEILIEASGRIDVEPLESPLS